MNDKKLTTKRLFILNKENLFVDELGSITNDIRRLIQQNDQHQCDISDEQEIQDNERNSVIQNLLPNQEDQMSTT